MNITATYPSMVKVLGQNNDDGTSLEMLHLSSDSFANDIVLKSPRKSSTSPDPFLGASDSMCRRTVQDKQNADASIPQILKRGHSFKVLTQLDKNTLKLATARELIQRLKSESQLHSTAHRVPEHTLDSLGNQGTPQREAKRSFGQIGIKENDSTDIDSGEFLLSHLHFFLHSFFKYTRCLMKHS